MRTRLTARPVNRKAQMVWLTLAILSAGAARGASAAPANDSTGGSTPVEGVAARWIQEADRQRDLGAYHLEAEALEKALVELPPGHPLRWSASQRLANVYRGGMGHFSRAAYWVQTLADELRPTPAGIDALFAFADARLNHGHLDEALAVYREILSRIMAPDEPYDRFDKRCGRAWEGEWLAKFPAGSDPIFPVDLTATNQLSLFVERARSGASQEARSVLDRGLPMRSAVEMGQTSKTWTSTRERLSRTVAGLGKGSLQSLEVPHGRQLAELIEQGDWRGLADFRFYHPLPGLERRIDEAIGDELQGQAMPALASLFYGQAIESRRESASPSLLAKEVFCRIHAGEEVSAADVPEVQIEAGGERRSLREWVDIWQRSISTAASRPTSIDLMTASISRLPLIRAPLMLREWQFRWRARRVWGTNRDIDVPPYADEFVPCIPVGSPRCLILNVGEAVEAVDVVGGRRLWTFMAPEENSMANPNQKDREKQLFVECARAGTAVIAGNAVYCHLAWGHHDTRRRAGGIFALRRSDGALLWSSSRVPELAGMQFGADPAVYRGVVLAVACQRLETIPVFYIAGMAAETGELLWVTHLFSGSSLRVCQNAQFLDTPASCGPPVVVDGVAYFCTGAGVAAAVRVLDGTLVWAIQYPRLQVTNRSGWATRAAISRPAGVISVASDLVLLAPIDSHHLLAVDRATGQVRYMEELLDLRAVAAADAQRAYLLEGTSIRAIRPGDGETAWRRELRTAGIVGVPTLSPRGLLCPTWEALFVLDPSTGGIRIHRQWTRDEACSYLQDFGDRVVGMSRTGLHVLARERLSDDERWPLPSGGTRPPADVVLPSRADKWLRWVLPAVDRGDFVLSDKDPAHMLIRSELLQMREIDPLPTLCWERLSPLPSGCEAVFDRHRVAVWSRSDLLVLDASSGRTLWNVHVDRLAEASSSGVVLGENDLFWWEDQEIRCYRVGTGEHLWAARFQGIIREIALSDRTAEVHVESGAARGQPGVRSAIFLDRETGEEITRHSASQPAPPPSSVRRPRKASPEADRAQAMTSCVSGDASYTFANRRIRCSGLQDGRERWHSPTITDNCRVMVPGRDHLLALTQGGRIPPGSRDGIEDMSYVRVFDIHTGEQVKVFKIPKRWVHVLKRRADGLLFWDCTFLYFAQEPAKSLTERDREIVARQGELEPDVIASLRMARDLEEPPKMEIPRLPSAPRIDGDLSDWSVPAGRQLDSVMDWKPDFAHRSAWKPRAYGGQKDLAAGVRTGQTADSFYLAVEVEDDVHSAAPGPPLWRLDSVTFLVAGAAPEESDPFMLTVSLIDGVPQLEWGTAVSTTAVSDQPGRVPTCGPGPRTLMLTPPTTSGKTLPVGAPIDVAVCRDNSSRRTVYELRIPKTAIPWGPQTHWDVFINDNDGYGREGALQLASSLWGVEESAIGGVDGLE